MRCSMSTGKPIQIAPTDTQVTIASDGSVSTENGQVGKIGVVQPADPMKLQAEGATYFVADAPTAPVPRPASCRARWRNPTSSRCWK